MASPVLLNRFEMGSRLGAGGYGTVYRAHDRRLERDVAVKVVETGPSSGPRVNREAKAAARLSHHGIVALFEFVHHEYGPEGGRAYLVSELVEGETVRRLIDRGAFSDRDVAELGADVCEALDHAHERGVVHRDIKPANLIVPFDNTGAKLMDFGIASLSGGDDLTATGDVLGTLAYMSPEQAKGFGAGPPGDLYSLALTLYEAWSGSNPRRRKSPAATLEAIDLPPPELDRLRPDLPPELTATIDACLDPDPEYRPAIEDLGIALENALPRLDDYPAGAARPGSPGRQRRSFRPGVLALALTISAAAAAWLYLGGTLAPLPIALTLAFPAWLLIRLAGRGHHHDRPLRTATVVRDPALAPLGSGSVTRRDRFDHELLS